MSQDFCLGPSFNVMQSQQQQNKKNHQKLPVFFDKIKTKALIKSLRHASLKSNVKSTSLKFHYCGINIKRDIDVQKTKVEKLV